jgi:L-asparaginase
MNSNSKKKIYVAYTGGTIGMQQSAQGFVPVPGFLAHTVEAMPEFFRAEMPDFTIHEYQPLIDSSDMTPEHWVSIAADIKANYADYDGFVVLHGTDTMAYTASALSFMLEDLAKPVIITGSQIPLAQLRSDGQVNLLNALYIAANFPVHEVTLFFNNQLFRGNRATKADADGFNAFASPNHLPLLQAGIHIEWVAGKPIVDDGAVLATTSAKTLQVAAVTPQPISVVTLYPGISLDVIRNMLADPVKALIIKSFGVGNAPQRPELLAVLQDAAARGIVIVNCTQCFKGKVNMGGYATGNALRQCGVISGADMTLEATLTKLHYLLSQNLAVEHVRHLMQQNLRGELS